jgi:hypothetical protein
MAAITLKRNSYFEGEVYINLGIYYSKIEIAEDQVSVFGIGLIFWSIQIQWLK